MRVDDYLLVNDITVLLNDPIIIYGAGNIGIRTFELLKYAGIKVHYFCDKDKNKKNICGCEVISVRKLKEVTEGKKYNIVLASDIYYEEMLKELLLKEINVKNVFTGWGICSGLAWNYNSPKISDDYRKFYKKEINKIITYQNDVYAISNLQKILTQSPEILIYQMGKVGSAAICKSIKEKNKNCLSVHVLCDYGDNEKGWALGKRCRDKLKTDGIKMISMIRDPIARYISEKLQGWNFVYWASEGNGKGGSLADRLTEDLLDDKAKISAWFSAELEQFTGIDVMEYPFDKTKGYTIIKKGKIELLILTTERLNENRHVLEEFVGAEGFQLTDYNRGNSKVIKYIYESIKKNLIIPESALDRYYKEDLFLQHFYSKEQIKKFREKWSGK